MKMIVRLYIEIVCLSIFLTEMGDYKFFEENAKTIVFQGRVIVKKKKR